MVPVATGVQIWPRSEAVTHNCLHVPFDEPCFACDLRQGGRWCRTCDPWAFQQVGGGAVTSASWWPPETACLLLAGLLWPRTCKDRRNSSARAPVWALAPCLGVGVRSRSVAGQGVQDLEGLGPVCRLHDADHTGLRQVEACSHTFTGTLWQLCHDHVARCHSWRCLLSSNGIPFTAALHGLRGILCYIPGGVATRSLLVPTTRPHLSGSTLALRRCCTVTRKRVTRSSQVPPWQGRVGSTRFHHAVRSC